MGVPNGVHHLAISTSDIKAQIEFFTEVLGMELVALYWMHGVPNAWHGFVKLADSSYLAFVQLPEMAGIEHKIGATHAGSPGGVSAGGTMQHLALNVNSEEELLAMRDRVRSHGINVWGPLDHGFCKSIYFPGPEDLTLEFATSEKGIDARAWIDPEVVDLAGINQDELQRYLKPAGFASQQGRVAQPPIDPSKPTMRGFPPEAYRKLVETPDEVVTATRSMPDPPVVVDGD